MANFSGAFLALGDLNDFIAPSQACVVSLNGKIINQDEIKVGTMQLQRPSSFPQTQTAVADGPIKVSLHDCLACSGCVTSAETVLLQHQSIDEFLARLADPSITVVVSLSPQSVVSLAAVYGLQPAQFVAKLTSVLKSRGVKSVFDITWPRDVSLLESAAEFIERYRRKVFGDAEMTDNATSSDGPAAPPTSSSATLPLLASACPGWVCYAEKTHGNFILPYMSTSKSPQAVMGTVLKRQWAVSLGLDPGSVYHCAVMPCYDKKLEAARDDFLAPVSDEAMHTTTTKPSVPETDSVLATTELYEWLQTLHIDWATVAPAPLDGPFTNQVSVGHGESYSSAGGSGGYMEYVFRTAAREIFGQELPAGPLPMSQGRNADIKECSIEVNGQRVLRFASAYGFRNIQGLMRKIKTGRCEYDYVEVMACPSGCLNGGGQVKPAPGQTAHQLIEQLEADYNDGKYLMPRPPQENPSVAALYRDWVRGVPGGQRARELLHTEYHPREKTVASAIADW